MLVSATGVTQPEYCLNYVTESIHLELCTLHNPAFKCIVTGCKGFRTSFGRHPLYCYVHANAATNSQKKLEKIEEKKVDAIEQYNQQFPHGTVARYKRNCHCQPCKEANRKYKKLSQIRHELVLKDNIVPKELDIELRRLYEIGIISEPPLEPHIPSASSSEPGSGEMSEE